MEEEEEEEEEFQQGHQSPVLSLITSDDGQDSSQEEYLEGLEGLEDPIPRLLAMSLDAWKDPSTFQDWLSFGSQPDLTETTLVGSFTTTIVGHSGAKFNEHELLEFVRYQQCPSDKNAIKVLNSSSREVGYLCTSVAMVLSPLVDILKINLEGEVICSRFKYDKSIPCVVTIFAESAAAQNAKDWILQHGLRLCDQPGTSLRSYEGTGVQEKGRIEKLGSLEPPNNVIKAKLLDHQKEGLWWLVNKEKSDELPPFWEVGNVTEGTGEENRVVHVSSGKKRKGGGMVSEKGTGEQNMHTFLDRNIKENSVRMADESSTALVAKQTLVVCPSAVCSTWENQLQEHTQKDHSSYTNPLSTECYWQRMFQKPLANGDEKGFSRLQQLMTTISLRRIKDKDLVGLPSKTVETVSFELSGEERVLYDQMESRLQGCYWMFFITADILHSHYVCVLFSVIQLRQLCNDSALCSMDLRSLLPSDNIGDASKHPELLRKMIDGLQDGEDIVCSVCLDPPTDATNHNL
uniref:Uncharacterized protein n=1 Tax=Populus alba TaxID=43335 RepID=A0A4U5QQK1_POPAL|nr:hypothetical protein D5086_0000071000 [Populus alba]